MCFIDGCSDESSEEESGDDDQLQPKELCLTSGDMAGLLQHWLLKKTNMKVHLLVDLVHYSLSNKTVVSQLRIKSQVIVT